jgi:hypothetical protein
VTRDRFNSSLWIGIAVSITLHAMLIVPLLLRMMTTSGEALALHATFNPDDIEPPMAMREPDIQLGLDDGSPSTLTWLGYREYEEHHAPPSDVEQAAFTDDPNTSSPLMPPTPLQQPSELPDDSQPSPEPAEQANGENNQKQTEQPQERSAQQSQAQLDGAEAIDAAPVLNADDAAPQDVATSPHRSATEAFFAFAEQLQRLMETAASAHQLDVTSQGAPSQSTTDAKQHADAQAAAAASSPPANPTAPQSDKDSDPSSIVEVPFDQIRLGKPLAAQGLTLRPQKPSFTTLTLMTAAPKNPLAEIEFLATGGVRDARVVESAADHRVDHAIEASLFRWRAEGEPLSALTGDETITVRIRIILVRRPQ